MWRDCSSSCWYTCYRDGLSLGNALLYCSINERSILSRSFCNDFRRASLLLALFSLSVIASLDCRRLIFSCLAFFIFFFLFGDKFRSLKVSSMRSYLTFLSRGESVAKDAKLLTSINQGFIFSSKKISNPKISKQHEFSMSSGSEALYVWQS